MTETPTVPAWLSIDFDAISDRARVAALNDEIRAILPKLATLGQEAFRLYIDMTTAENTAVRDDLPDDLSDGFAEFVGRTSGSWTWQDLCERAAAEIGGWCGSIEGPSWLGQDEREEVGR